MQQQTIGRYQVLEEIASGGQGTVYRAWDTGSGRVVALKVLHPHLASDLGVLERFRREAQLAAAVVHPNITTIYEVGQHGNNHFIAMEYLPDSIHNLIVSTGRLPIDRAVDICRQAAVGLEAASRRGIIHRDIKPQNLLLAPDGTVKVTDFGIARATALSTMTRTGALMGTPHYMSPEQAQGQRVDIRSDIYSLGIVLYQMLTGQLPFEANTPYEVIRQQVEQRPGPVRRLRSDIPGAVERIVNRCLEKNPERRYQSPGDLARALGEAVPGTGRERIRQQQRAPAAPGSPPRQPAQPAQRRAERARPNTTWMQSWARAWQKTHRSRWAWMLPVIPVLIALVVAAVRLDVVDLSAMGAWIGTGSQPAVQNTPAPPVSTPDNGITIPDRNLRTAIAATLNIAAGEPITAADMAKLTEFDAPDSFISDLSGLEAAINLKELNLRGNAIADLSPLAGLVNLRHLDFSGNSISDVSPLGGSPNIAYLYIAGNLISDVAPLAGLTQLRHLHISDNSISDVSPLAALPNLEELFLGMNSISDLAPLVGNSGLGAADEVEIDRNPLNVAAVNIFIPALEERGVNVIGAPSPTLALAGTEFEDFFNWTAGNIGPANVANRVVETFGQDWRLADWNDVKLAWELYYWDMKDVFDRTHYLLVSRDGAYQADPGSWYFIEDHNGSKPPSFHSWDELGNHQISLETGPESLGRGEGFRR